MLVTGGSGFLGGAVVAELVAAGHVVRALQRRATRSGAAEVITGDVRDPAAIAAAVAGADVVIHAAGLAHVFQGTASAPFDEINARGAAVAAAAAGAAGVRHFVQVSSVAVYGGSGEDGTEGAPCRPHGKYAVSKAAGETAVIEAARGSSMAVTVLRLATLYGAGDRGNVQRLLRLIDAGRFIWVGTGSNLKSLIHRDDAARACAVAATFAVPPGGTVETWNVSAPPALMRDVVEELARALGRPLPRWHVPGGAARLFAAAGGRIAPARADSLRKWLSDDVYPGRRFEQRFDFVPRVSLRDGIEGQVAWWRAEGAGRP